MLFLFILLYYYKIYLFLKDELNIVQKESLALERELLEEQGPTGQKRHPFPFIKSEHRPNYDSISDKNQLTEISDLKKYVFMRPEDNIIREDIEKG